MEELIGEEDQQRGNRLKQDAIGDVTTAKKTNGYILHVIMQYFTSAAPDDTGKATKYIPETWHEVYWQLSFL